MRYSLRGLLFLFFLGMGFLGSVEAKVRLLTFHYNDPDFLELQIKAFQKFSLNDYEMIVFNDAPRPEWELAIQQVCEQYNIVSVRYQQEWHRVDPLTEYIHNILHAPSYKGAYLGVYAGQDIESLANQPSVRHSHVIQYALDHFGYDHDDIVVIVDGDCFPIRPIDFRALLEGKKIIGPYKCKNRAKYIWVPIVAIDMPTLPNKTTLKFHPDVIENVLYDTGSHTHYYLQKNRKVPIGKYDFYSSTTSIPDPDELKMLCDSLEFTQKEQELIAALMQATDAEFHIDFHFFHYVGSSWYAKSGIKFDYTMQLMDSILY